VDNRFELLIKNIMDYIKNPKLNKIRFFSYAFAVMMASIFIPSISMECGYWCKIYSIALLSIICIVLAEVLVFILYLIYCSSNNP